jgi:hypothetical protein
MSGPPRDWDRELAKIDQVIAKQPASEGSDAGVSQRPAGQLPAGPAVRRRSVALTWFWVVLAMALAVALPLWPYDKSCGVRLIFFLGGTGVTLVVGVLGATNSWTHRRGFAHLLSLLVVAWSLIIGAGELLPRVGYARAARAWTCQAAGTPAPAPAPGPAQRRP